MINGKTIIIKYYTPYNVLTYSRFKFNDDIVTPATLKHVLENNFGGEKIAYSKLKKRSTNAYMLVYIRESQQDKILEQVTEKEIGRAHV